MHWLLITFIAVIAIGFTVLLCVCIYCLCCYSGFDFIDDKDWRNSKTTSSSRTVAKDEYGWSTTYTSLPSSVITERESHFTTIPLESQRSSSTGFAYPEEIDNRRQVNAAPPSFSTPVYSSNQRSYPHESNDVAEVSYYSPPRSPAQKMVTSSYSTVIANASPPYPPDHDIRVAPPPVSSGFHPSVIPEYPAGYSSVTTRYITSHPESTQRNGSYTQPRAHSTEITSERTRVLHNAAQRYPSRTSLYDNT